MVFFFLILAPRNKNIEKDMAFDKNVKNLCAQLLFLIMWPPLYKNPCSTKFCRLRLITAQKFIFFFVTQPFLYTYKYNFCI